MIAFLFSDGQTKTHAKIVLSPRYLAKVLHASMENLK